MLEMQNTILRYVLFILSKDWINPRGDSLALYLLVHEVQFKLKRLTWHKVISVLYFTHYIVSFMIFIFVYLLSGIALCEDFLYLFISSAICSGYYENTGTKDYCIDL